MTPSLTLIMMPQGAPSLTLMPQGARNLALIRSQYCSPDADPDKVNEKEAARAELEMRLRRKGAEVRATARGRATLAGRGPPRGMHLHRREPF